MLGNLLDDERFEQEALCWLPDVTRYAMSLAREEAGAEDLVQDTFLLACERWHQFEPGSQCRAWLFTICRNRFYRSHRRDERIVAADTPELEALAAATLHASARSSALDEIFARTEVLEAIDAAIAALPATFRDVVLLVDVHDHAYEAAAVVLDVPIGTVRSRLFRARRLLQETLLVHARDAGIGTRAVAPSSEEAKA